MTDSLTHIEKGEDRDPHLYKLGNRFLVLLPPRVNCHSRPIITKSQIVVMGKRGRGMRVRRAETHIIIIEMIRFPNSHSRNEHAHPPSATLLSWQQFRRRRRQENYFKARTASRRGRRRRCRCLFRRSFSYSPYCSFSSVDDDGRCSNKRKSL